MSAGISSDRDIGNTAARGFRRPGLDAGKFAQSYQKSRSRKARDERLSLRTSQIQKARDGRLSRRLRRAFAPSSIDEGALSLLDDTASSNTEDATSSNDEEMSEGISPDREIGNTISTEASDMQGVEDTDQDISANAQLPTTDPSFVGADEEISTEASGSDEETSTEASGTEEEISAESSSNNDASSSKTGAGAGSSSKTGVGAEEHVVYSADVGRRRLPTAETSTEKADDVFYAYYNSEPPYTDKNTMALEPYQMVLTMVASPQVSLQQTEDDLQRPCHQLFATSTGSGKTLTLLNSLWQYATYVPDDGEMFSCYVIAPPSAKSEITNTITNQKKNVVIPGMHRFGAAFHKRHDIKESIDTHLKRRNIFVLTYTEFVKHVGTDTAFDANFPPLLALRSEENKKKLKVSPKSRKVFKRALETDTTRIALFFDEAHVLVLSGDKGMDPKALDNTRQAIHDNRIGCCFFFTWTFMTKSVVNAVCLMMTLRGKAWCEGKKIKKKDWLEHLSDPNFDKNRFFHRDKDKQGRLDTLYTQLKELKCPITNTDYCNNVPKPLMALQMDQTHIDLLFEACLEHVFYLDVSIQTRATMPISSKGTGTTMPLRGRNEPLHDAYEDKPRASEYVKLVLAKYGFSSSLKPTADKNALAKWYNLVQNQEDGAGKLNGKWKLLALYNDILDFSRPLRASYKKSFRKLTFDNLWKVIREAETRAGAPTAKALKELKNKDNGSSMTRNRSEAEAYASSADGVPPSYYAWTPPILAAHVKSDKQQVAKWNSSFEGKFALIQPNYICFLPAGKDDKNPMFDNLDARLAEMKGSELSKNPTELSLFPDWSNLKSIAKNKKTEITSDNACNLKVGVDLKAFVGDKDADINLLDRVLECRTPKLFFIVKKLRTQMKNTESKFNSRNAAIFIPVERSGSKELLRTVIATLSAALRLEHRVFHPTKPNAKGCPSDPPAPQADLPLLGQS